jgi:hypothetical protein
MKKEAPPMPGCFDVEEKWAGADASKSGVDGNRNGVDTSRRIGARGVP